MIVKKVFDFKQNLKDMSSYRVSLKNLKTPNLINALKEAEEQRFDKREVSLQTTRRRLSDSISLENSYKTISSFMFFQHRNIKQISRIDEEFNNKTYKFISNANKELIKLDDAIKGTELSLNSFFNKAIVRSFFEEKGIDDEAYWYDYKTEKVFSRLDSCHVKNGFIENKLINNLSLDIVSIEVDYAESTFSNQVKAIDINKDTSLIFREGKIWNYIVGVRDFNEDGQVQSHESGKLALYVNLDGFNETNHIYIESGSSLPIEFEEASLTYWDGSAWSALNNVKEINLFNRKFISFETIYTNKLKLIFKQKSYIDVSKIKNTSFDEENLKEFINRSYLNFFEQEEKSEFKRIYDLSLKELKVSHKQNWHLGYYRDFNKVFIKNILSCYLEFDYGVEQANSYIEKYLKLDLYGGAVYEANKNTSISNTKRLELLVPVPGKELVQKELLVFKNTIAKVNFFPKQNLNAISVYKEGVELTLGADYLISLNGGTSFLDTINNSEKAIVGNFLVKILNKDSSEYKIEYELHENIEFLENKNLRIQNGKLAFTKDLKNAKGFVEAMFIIRNKNVNNLSSNIQSFKYLIEEDSTEDLVLLEEDFKLTKESYRGTLNVV